MAKKTPPRLTEVFTIREAPTSGALRVYKKKSDRAIDPSFAREQPDAAKALKKLCRDGGYRDDEVLAIWDDTNDPNLMPGDGGLIAMLAGGLGQFDDDDDDDEDSGEEPHEDDGSESPIFVQWYESGWSKNPTPGWYDVVDDIDVPPEVK